MSDHTKRELVEEMLNSICRNLDLCENASDPYDCEEEDFFLEGTLGLIWKERFSGWTWNRPTNEQVEKLYPDARIHFELDKDKDGSVQS
jgi:hypothetical protein